MGKGKSRKQGQRAGSRGQKTVSKKHGHWYGQGQRAENIGIIGKGNLGQMQRANGVESKGRGQEARTESRRQLAKSTGIVVGQGRGQESRAEGRQK